MARSGPSDPVLFHVSPFPLIERDEGRCLFLVQNLADGTVREITVKRDEQGFHEFLVDGTGYYDAEHEPDYLTIGLIDMAERMIAEYEAKQGRVEAGAVVGRMWATSVGSRAN